MAHNASFNRYPKLVSFVNGASTVTYGNVLVWDTTTVYDSGEPVQYQMGMNAALGTATAEGAFPAGVLWSNNSSMYSTDTIVGGSAQGFLVVEGLHPHVCVYGTSTINDLLYVSGANSGCAYADNTLYSTVTPIGRATASGTATVTQSLSAWVRCEGGF